MVHFGYTMTTEQAGPIGRLPVCYDQDRDAAVEAVRPYAEAGFTDVALVQIGGASRRRRTV
ncbi:hypothetical protein ACWD4J_07805 [Streptomyces sp. NPDC002577]